jgi:C_GCAxxG_C_C family probable redox protein
MTNVERAVSCFEEGFSCSQSVLSTYGPQLGLDRETALRVATAFAGGMGRMGETCGAVTGAFMVIGLKHGRIGAEDEEPREKTYSLVGEFCERFKSRHGSILCRDLLSYDLSIPEERELAREEALRESRCLGFVRDAAEIIEQILKWR